MRRTWLLTALIVLAVTGCGVMRNGCNHVRSAVTMLDYHITLYTCLGDTIQTWHTRASVATQGGEAWWVGDDGEQHHIAGTFTVEGR